MPNILQLLVTMWMLCSAVDTTIILYDPPQAFLLLLRNQIQQYAATPPLSVNDSIQPEQQSVSHSSQQIQTSMQVPPNNNLRTDNKADQNKHIIPLQPTSLPIFNITPDLALSKSISQSLLMYADAINFNSETKLPGEMGSTGATGAPAGKDTMNIGEMGQADDVIRNSSNGDFNNNHLWPTPSISKEQIDIIAKIPTIPSSFQTVQLCIQNSRTDQLPKFSASAQEMAYIVAQNVTIINSESISNNSNQTNSQLSSSTQQIEGKAHPDGEGIQNKIVSELASNPTENSTIQNPLNIANIAKETLTKPTKEVSSNETYNPINESIISSNLTIQPNSSAKQSQSGKVDNATQKNNTGMLENSTLNSSDTPGSQSAAVKQFKQIKSYEFNGVGLYHNVPDQFLQGEYFQFNGVILNYTAPQNARKIYINIYFQETSTKSQFWCRNQMALTSKQFQVSCLIAKPGRFFLFVFPGTKGYASPKQRVVNGFDYIRFSNGLSLYSNYTQRPTQIKLLVEENNVVIKWDSEAPLTNITFSQEGQPDKQYLLSNWHSRLEVPLADFKNSSGEFLYLVRVSQADSKDGTLLQINSSYSHDPLKIEFMPTQHHYDYSQQGQQEIISPPIPWTVMEERFFKFNAVFQEDIKNEVFITLPSGILAKVHFKRILQPNAVIKAGTPISLELALVMGGSYIIEINAITGFALVNQPIYVGSHIPILPDYIDLTSSKFNYPLPKAERQAILQQYITKKLRQPVRKQPDINSTLEEKKDFMLFLLNGLRKVYGVSPLVFDQKLNNIAQYHSNDMVSRNYFNHTSIVGESLKDRALKFNLTSIIGENIGSADTLIEAHLGLQRSASHLESSISTEWTRVGIGISVNAKKFYIVAFEFSSRDLGTSPLSKTELESYRSQVVSLLINNNLLAKENPSISQYIGEWLATKREKPFFEFLFSRKKLEGKVWGISFKVQYSRKFVDEIRKANFFPVNKYYGEFGVSLTFSKDSFIEGFAVFNA